MKIKKCTDGKEQACSGLVTVLIDPQFLQRVAHADKDAVRACNPDVVASLFDVLRAEDGRRSLLRGCLREMGDMERMVGRLGVQRTSPT